MLLVLMVACSAGPPSISDFKTTKTKDASEAASTFDARDTLYAVANIANPPKDGKVVGRLVIVDVEGQQPGPVPGLESTLSLTGGMNKADFTFTPPTAGWPNGKYQVEAVLLDASGAEKDKKTADFTTTGNQPAPVEGEATSTAEEVQPESEDDTTTQQ